MMRAISSGMSSTARSEALILDPGLPVPIDIRPMRNARRLRLRFDDATGTLKLTCPSRMSRKAALAWALDQRDWIDKQLASAIDAEPFEPRAVIPIAGEDTRVVWNESSPRTPRLVEGELRCGGPEAGLPRRVQSFLKRLALDTMSREVAEFAELAGVSATS